MISFHGAILAVQAFATIWVSVYGQSAEILKGPDTQVTQTGATVWFTCHIIGTPTWVINGSERQPQAYGQFETRGFNFSHVHIATEEYNLTISVVALLDINNTDIQCQAVSINPEQVQESQTAKLIIATPPLPPAPEVLLINATVLQLSWEPPFTWSEYPVLNYTVRMHNTSSTEQYTWTRTISAAVNTIEVISTVSLSYHELVFYVTARNDIGESSQGVIRGGFPVVPGEFNFSYITHEVCFQQSTGNPQLEIFFKSPQVCQTAHYRITITNSTGDHVITKVGHNLMSGLLISERITSGLSLNRNYSFTLIAENLAGSNTPVTIHFNTNFHLPTNTITTTTATTPDINSRLPTVATNDVVPTVTTNIPNAPTNESTTTTASTNVINAATTDIITTATTNLAVSHTNTTSDGGVMDSFTIGTAVVLGVVMAICISVAVFVGIIYFCRMHKRHSEVEKLTAGPMLAKPIPPMITNPIYNGPIYDIIATEPPKSPVKQKMSENPRYSNDPPSLPPPRKQSVNTSPVNESENEKYGASLCNELTPIGDEYTIMEPASVRTMQPTFPLDPKDEYVTMKS